MSTFNVQAALELALASLQFYSEDNILYAPESRSVLLDALAKFGERPILMKHDGSVIGAAYNNTYSRILTWSGDSTARVWDAQDALLHVLRHAGAVVGATWSSDDDQLVIWSEDATVRVWDAVTGLETLRLLHPATVGGVSWSLEEDYLLTWSEHLVSIREINLGLEKAGETH